MVARRPVKAKVVGSNPTRGASQNKIGIGRIGGRAWVRILAGEQRTMRRTASMGGTALCVPEACNEW